MMRTQPIGRPNPPAGLIAFLKVHLRSIILLGILLLFLYAVVPQVAGLGRSFHVVLQANRWYILLAFICLCVIYLLATALYMILSLHPLGFRRTLEAQIASGFSGKLLPSGLGVLGLFVQYLRRQGHSLSEAVAVASVNNLAAIMGHVMLLTGFFLAGVRLPRVALGMPTLSAANGVVICAAVVALACILYICRRRVSRGWSHLMTSLSVYKQYPGKVVAAIIVSVPQTFAYMGVLYACALALGVHVPFTEIFMVATFSMLVGTLVPVPGGIVGAEAGLTAGFVAYGLSLQQGLMIALLYRAFIYWLPILPGMVAFAYRRRDYL